MKSLRSFPFDQPSEPVLHVPSHMPSSSLASLSQNITDTLYPLFVHLDNKIAALQQEVSSLNHQVQVLSTQVQTTASAAASAAQQGTLEQRQDHARVINASRFVNLSGRDGECPVDALPSENPGAPWAGQMTVSRLHTLTAAQVNAIIDHYNLERLEGKQAVPPGELKRRIYLIRFLGVPA